MDRLCLPHDQHCRRRLPERGAHGYDPDCPANQGQLIIDSPRVAAGTDLGTRDLVDLFPTLCILLGLDFPPGLSARPFPLLGGE